MQHGVWDSERDGSNSCWLHMAAVDLFAFVCSEVSQRMVHDGASAVFILMNIDT